MAFTRNVPNCPEKSLIYSLKNAQFKNDKPIIIWHDAINNSLSNFKESTALNKEGLYGYLEECINYGVVGFLFFKRHDLVIDLTDCLADVSPPGIIFINMRRHLPLEYKFFDHSFPHPDIRLETKCFDIIQNCCSLMELTKAPGKRRIPGKSRPSKKRFFG